MHASKRELAVVVVHNGGRVVPASVPSSTALAAAAAQAASRSQRQGCAWRPPPSLGSVRWRFDPSRVPPWRRWAKTGLAKLNPKHLPEVEPAIDILTTEDADLLAGAIVETVPWKRKVEHHRWLHEVSGRVVHLLPRFQTRDIVRIILAFGDLYPRRSKDKLLFYNYEAYSALFQAMPLTGVTSKTLVPLLLAYHRMKVMHEPFFRAACARIISGEVELQNPQLVEVVRLHRKLQLKNPQLFELVAEVVDLRFPYFSEDDIGEIARSFCALKHYSPILVQAFHCELPRRMHEYSWWNLIDIAEMYLDLQVDDPDIIQRIGNEVFKLVISMRQDYTAKALKVLAFLETSDKRTFRLLIRALPKTILELSPEVTAEAILACAAINVEPLVVYHRLRGERLYRSLTQRLTRDIGLLTAKMTTDVFAALARVWQPEGEMALAVEKAILDRPHKYHAEHLISLLRDFATLKHCHPDLRALLLQRRSQLRECTPSALCAIPAALVGHPRARADAGPSLGLRLGPGDSKSLLIVDGMDELEASFLAETSRLLCEPGQYNLPQDPRTFRGKDDFWFQQMRQQHYRLRRRRGGGTTAKAATSSVAKASESQPVVEDEEQLPAVAHVSRQECVQLVSGMSRLQWREEKLLEGITSWLCIGRRHAELEPREVSAILGAFSTLNFARPLLRVALEHALQRTANDIAPADCLRALRGALVVGMDVRSPAVLALVRQCTAQIALVPPDSMDSLSMVSSTLRYRAEQHVLDEMSQGGSMMSIAPLPLELHLFSEAVTARVSVVPG